jgi:hypothetical protein
MVYCVVRVGKVQRDVILCGERWKRAAKFYIMWRDLGKGSVMVYCVVGVGKGQRNVLLFGEGWEMSA